MKVMAYAEIRKLVNMHGEVELRDILPTWEGGRVSLKGHYEGKKPFPFGWHQTSDRVYAPIWDNSQFGIVAAETWASVHRPEAPEQEYDELPAKCLCLHNYSAKQSLALWLAVTTVRLATDTDEEVLVEFIDSTHLVCERRDADKLILKKTRVIVLQAMLDKPDSELAKYYGIREIVDHSPCTGNYYSFHGEAIIMMGNGTIWKCVGHPARRTGPSPYDAVNGYIEYINLSEITQAA